MPPIRSTVLAVALAFAALGCEKKNGAPTKASQASAAPIATLPSAATGTVDDHKSAALAAGIEFVASVREGRVATASLGVAFKKIIAPPELDVDKAAGYSEPGVRAWLDAAKGGADSDGLKVDIATAEYAVLSTAAGKPDRLFLRLAKTGGIWIAEHVRFKAKSTIDIAFVGNAPAATLATAFFVEAALADNKAEIEALLTKAAKGKIAPPLFDGDKPQGYSRSKLNSALTELFPAGVAFVGLAQEQAGLKAAVTVAVGGKNRVLQLKLVPGAAPGEFLIDDVQQK